MRYTALAALAFLSACGSESGNNVAPRSTDEIPQAAEASRIAPTPNSIEAEADTGKGAVTAASAEEMWLGRFAATTELCRGGVWNIGETRIVTDGETSCDIDRVARAAGQVTLRLSCLAEGMPSQEEWVLTPEGTERMRVRRNNGPETVDVDLIRCR